MGMGRSLTALAVVLVLCTLPTYSVGQQTNYNVGAYYYAWYDQWFHLGPDKTVRKHLVPQQQPQLGWYDSNNAEIIGRHYDMARYAGIDYFTVSWWGQGSKDDNVLKNVMIDHPNRGNIKLCVMLEGNINNDNVYDQMHYLASTYFSKPGYYKINGKPVVYVYQTRTRSKSDLQDFVNKMKQAARDAGFSDIYIVGDEIWSDSNGQWYYFTFKYDESRINLFDAITNYDVYGYIREMNDYNSSASGRYVSSSDLDNWNSWNERWKQEANSRGVNFIPGIFPGYNDEAVRDESATQPISRKLDNNDSEFGSLFAGEIARVKDDTDESIGNAITITSWNEWFEDTQIEPVTGSATTNVDDSSTGNQYTGGLYYEAYGDRYLNILREELLPEPASLMLMLIGLSMLKKAGLIR